MSNFLVGNNNYAPVWKDHGTGGGTSYTLDGSGTAVGTLVYVGGSIQEPGTDYTISGTAITMTTSVTSGIGVLTCQLYALGTVNVPVDNSVTAAKTDLTLAEGSLIYGTGADAWTLLAKGAANQQLAMNAGATAPEWVTVSSGGWEFVQTVTASTSSTIDIGTNNIDSGYDYMIVANNIDNSADLTVANSPIIQYGTGGTPTYQTSGYLSRYIFGRTTITGSAVGPTTGIPMATSNNIGGAAAGEIWSAEMVIPDPAANAISIARANAGMYSDAGSSDISITTGWRTTAEVITGFRITPGTGTFITGDFTLYRRANA